MERLLACLSRWLRALERRAVGDVDAAMAPLRRIRADLEGVKLRAEAQHRKLSDEAAELEDADQPSRHSTWRQRAPSEAGRAAVTTTH